MIWRKGFLAALSAMALAVFAALTPWQVSAQQEPNHAFSGTVLIDGQAPPGDSVLSAWAGTFPLGEAPVRQGKFRIVIPQRKDLTLAGHEITFRLDGRKLHGAAVWKPGGITELKLTISRNEYLNALDGRTPSTAPKTGGSSSIDRNFVGDEPLVCDILRAEGILNGKIRNEVRSVSSDIRANIKQAGCLLIGEFKVVSPLLRGSGPLHGTVDGNFVRFTVPGETSDAGEDLNFSGIMEGNRISGQFFLPRTREIGEWILAADGAVRDRLLREWILAVESAGKDRLLSEARSQLQRQPAAAPPEPAKTGDHADSVSAPQAAQTAIVGSQTEPSPSDVETAARTKESRNRGFFSNSLSGESTSIDKALEPTTLAVIGILMTLLATGVQLFRGN